MQHVDVIVVGTGGMGSAALYHVASRGLRVLGLDRFPVGHARGSSHGQTRLIRQAYFEHPDYVPLLLRAYALWRALEEETKTSLLVESGLVMAGPASGEVISGARRAAALHGLAIEELLAAEARRRWPFVLEDAWSVVYEPRGGYLLVESCVEAYAAAAVRRGARVETGVVVQAWREEGSGVCVETHVGKFYADRLVLTPGAWASDLLRLSRPPLVVLRKNLFWYEAGESLSTIPCFAFDTAEGFFYGFPKLDGRGVKIAEHTGGRVVTDPLQLDRSLDKEEQERVRAVLGKRLPSVRGDCSDHAACMYTMTPDAHFLLGVHPESTRVALAAGFSGHGFKFASVMGEVLADLTERGETALPISFLSPQRFETTF